MIAARPAKTRAKPLKDLEYDTYRKSGFTKTNGRTKRGLDGLALLGYFERLYGRSEFPATADAAAGRLDRTDH